MTLLPPQEFTFTRYLSVILSWDSIKTTENYVAALMNLNILGYCDGADVEVRPRPRPDDYAVMFEQDEYQSWCHPQECHGDFLAALVDMLIP